MRQFAAADEYCFEATACLKTFFVLFFFFFQSCDEPSSQLLQLAGREKALITWMWCDGCSWSSGFRLNDYLSPNPFQCLPSFRETDALKTVHRNKFWSNFLMDTVYPCLRSRLWAIEKLDDQNTVIHSILRLSMDKSCCPSFTNCRCFIGLIQEIDLKIQVEGLWQFQTRKSNAA